jgi:hypothetical protein
MLNPVFPPPIDLCPACVVALPPGAMVYVAYICGERAPRIQPGACACCGRRDLVRTLIVPMKPPETG